MIKSNSPANQIKPIIWTFFNNKNSEKFHNSIELLFIMRITHGNI